MSSAPKQVVGVGVFLLNDNKVLLGRRLNVVGSGTFALPGGKLEFGESFEDCAIREVKEETGLDVSRVELVTICNHIIAEPKPMQLVAVLVRAKLNVPDQKPVNVEPEKCDGWDWYEWDNLPSPLFPPLESAVLRGVNPFLHTLKM